MDLLVAVVADKEVGEQWAVVQMAADNSLAELVEKRRYSTERSKVVIVELKREALDDSVD